MPFRIDFKSGKPVYLQIIDEIKGSAASGALRPGEALPSIGALAGELRVNPNAIAKAYTELVSIGVIEAAAGGGYVLADPQDASRKDRRRKALTAVGALYERPGDRRPPPRKMFTFAQALLRRLGLAKREELSAALRTIKAEGPAQSDLEGFIGSTTSKIEGVLQARVHFIADYGELLSLVNSFPRLRSTRAPVSARGQLLVSVFSDNELTAVLQVAGKTAGEEYDSEELEFLSDVADQIGIWTGRLRLRRERQEGEYALDIQRGLLPREIPQVSGFSIAGSWQPARTVGGDYYDVFKLSETKVALVIADVSGKGIPAALLMANLQATVKAYSEEHLTPSEVCRKVNRAVCKSITVGKFITFFYAVLDTEQKRLNYVNAGHNPGIVARQNGSCVTLEAGGPVLGVFPEAAYEDDAVTLLPGDRIVIYTDGLTEALDGHGEEFGEERLIALVGKTEAPALQLRDGIMQSVSEFCRDDFPDDATVLTVCVN